MKICFYAPFKPLDHPHPSGDLVIARGLFEYLARAGHRLRIVSPLRARWIYWKPWIWPRLLKETRRALRQVARFRPDVWLTYHTYYKAPDLLGPRVSRSGSIPYVIFQASYSTKHRRKMRTWPGFMLNRGALTAADHIFANRRDDLINLRRLVPSARLSYVPPGIYPEQFVFDAGARERIRHQWRIGHAPVVISAAMFRPGVKSRGLAWVIRHCGRLRRQGFELDLLIAGDGREKAHLKALAKQELPNRSHFTGRLPRREMAGLYSAGDLFAFPGIDESLGMVYLEAQSCGLPVVAFRNGGIPEVVAHGRTGYLTPLYDEDAFSKALAQLVNHPQLRREMGLAASRYVRRRHDLNQNYRRMESQLRQVIAAPAGGAISRR